MSRRSFQYYLALSEALIRKKPLNWLEGLGLCHVVVRLSLTLRSNPRLLRWGLRRLSFEAGRNVFEPFIRYFISMGDSELMQKIDQFLSKAEWQSLINDETIQYVLRHQNDDILGWLDSKDLGKDCWSRNIVHCSHGDMLMKGGLPVVRWFMEHGVDFAEHPSVLEPACLAAICNNDVYYLQGLKDCGVLKTTPQMLRQLVDCNSDVVQLAKVMQVTLADLDEETLELELMSARPNVLQWLASEKITPQQCRVKGNAAIAFAMKEGRLDYLDWLWDVGLPADEFADALQRLDPDFPWPKIHAWFEASTREST